MVVKPESAGQIAIIWDGDTKYILTRASTAARVQVFIFPNNGGAFW